MRARQYQLRRDDTGSGRDAGAGAVGVDVGVGVVDAAGVDAVGAVGAAAADVDADGDDAQRTKQRVKATKRMTEDRAILVLTVQRADLYAKNRVTAAVVDLAGAGAGGDAVVPGPTDAGGGADGGAAVVAADMQPPTLGHRTAQTASSAPSFLPVHLGTTEYYHHQKHRSRLH